VGALLLSPILKKAIRGVILQVLGEFSETQTRHWSDLSVIRKLSVKMSQEVSAGVKNYSTFTGKLNLLGEGKKIWFLWRKMITLRWHQSSLNISLRKSWRKIVQCEGLWDTARNKLFTCIQYLCQTWHIVNSYVHAILWIIWCFISNIFFI